MFRTFLLVGIGGGIGSMLRYAVMLALPHSGKDLLWATCTVNLVGCLLIGVLAGATLKSQWMSQMGWPLLATGLCGGFTTFSAFALDNVKLYQSGAGLTAVVYSALSLALGTILCYAGYRISLPATI